MLKVCGITDDYFAGMAAMAGVPMLSMDLEKLPTWQKDEVAKWMRIYSQRIEPFQKQGRWNMVYRNGSLSYMTSILGEDALVLVVDSGASLKSLDFALVGKRTIIMNLGYAPVCIRGVLVLPAQAVVP